MPLLALPVAVWLTIVIVAAFALGLLGWTALSLWRNLGGLKRSLAEARTQVTSALDEVNSEMRRATEALERIGRDRSPEPKERGY